MPTADRFFVWEMSVMAFFTIELITRIYCLNDFYAFVGNPFCVLDAVVVLLDFFAFFAQQLVGDLPFSKAPRLLRIIKLIRIIKVVRAARLMNTKTKKKTQEELMEELKNKANEKLSILDRFGIKFLMSKMLTSHTLMTGFLEARKEGLNMLEELLHACQSDSSGRHKEESVKNISDMMEQVQQNISDVLIAIEEYQAMFEVVDCSISTSMVARSILNSQRAHVHHLVHEGVLEQGEGDAMTAKIEYKMKELGKLQVIDQPKGVTLLRTAKWATLLEDEVLEEILKIKEEKIVLEGEAMQYTASEAFIVVQGVAYDANGEQYGKGASFYELELFMGGQAKEMTAKGGNLLLWGLKKSALEGLMRKYDTMRWAMWTYIGKQQATDILMSSGEGYTKKYVREVSEKLHYEEYATITPIKVPASAVVVLLTGRASINGGKSVGAIASIKPPKNVSYEYEIVFDKGSSCVCDTKNENFLITITTSKTSKSDKTKSGSSSTNVTSEL